ncbi:MAG TPA: glycosyltransferase family 2 protein [Acidimicrobiales bacterium]|jgi:glycosyltransferase involved in cell wall biosynthesis|nr:glycosyltransferase family 2 protein [Acidimicrobiales bacterium]
MISVVMPAHDEEPFLGAAVRDVAEGMRSRGPFEIVLVENGSTDGTAAVAKGLLDDIAELRVLNLGVADYGKALRMGFLAATGEVAAFFDVDYFDLEFLDRAMALMEGPDGPSVVVGSKRGPGAVDTRPWTRRMVTLVFSTTLKVGFGLGVSDTHGMKVLRREPMVPLAEACRFGTDLFDTELILRAERAGLRSGEVPVIVQELRPSRSSIARRIPRTIANLVRLRIYLWRERA